MVSALLIIRFPKKEVNYPTVHYFTEAISDNNQELIDRSNIRKVSITDKKLILELKNELNNDDKVSYLLDGNDDELTLSLYINQNNNKSNNSQTHNKSTLVFPVPNTIKSDINIVNILAND